MMLPLEVRKNRLLAIHIRAIALEFTKYKLLVINEEGKEFISNDTEDTMVSNHIAIIILLINFNLSYQNLS